MKALKIAAILSAILSIVKGGAFFWSGSLAVLASFLDSLVDTFLSFINFKVSRLAKVRADREHPYGHGGFEVLTALMQGGLIAGSGILVWWHAMDRLFSLNHGGHLNLQRLPVVIGVLAFSFVGSFVIMKILSSSKAAIQKNDARSLSLNADHAHYAGDVWQGGVALLAVLLTWFYGVPWIDIVAGIVSGSILLMTSFPLIRESARDIMNADSDSNLRRQVEKIIENCGIDEVKGIHRLRTRSLGPNRFVDFHLKLPNQIPLIEAHEISYNIESMLKKSIPGLDILMHLDPESEPDDDFDDD